MLANKEASRAKYMIFTLIAYLTKYRKSSLSSVAILDIALVMLLLTVCCYTKKNILPNHFLFFRLPWCQRKIMQLEIEANNFEKNGDIAKAMNTYSKLMDIEPANKKYRSKRGKLLFKLLKDNNSSTQNNIEQDKKFLYNK